MFRPQVCLTFQTGEGSGVEGGDIKKLDPPKNELIREGGLIELSWYSFHQSILHTHNMTSPHILVFR